ncbi:sulfonate transport system permease protein [Bradyrhizobium sp. USDA 4341]
MTTRSRTGQSDWLMTSASGLAGVAALLLLWSGLSSSGLLSHAFLPSPSATLEALKKGLFQGNLLQQTGYTAGRMLEGWLLASLIGVLIGAMVGLSATVRAYLEPTLEFLRPLPPSATVPLAIAMFGLGQGMVLFVVVFGSIWPPLLSTVQGLSMIDQRLHEVARCIGLSQRAFVTKIVLPGSAPGIVAGMRLSLSIALILAVLGEMITAQNGLGSDILHSARSFNAARTFAAIGLLSGIGIFSNFLLLGFERQFLAWNRRFQ